MPWLITYRCDKCGFETSNSFFWGIFRYKLPDGSLARIRTSIGWCHSCHNMRPIEKLLSEKQISEKLRSSNRKLREIKKPFLGWLFKRKRSEAEYLRKAIDDVRALFRVMALRKERTPRCLECGSNEVSSMGLLPYPGEGKEVKLEMLHPGCGGQLYAHSPIIHCVVSPIDRFYDVEGNPIPSY